MHRIFGAGVVAVALVVVWFMSQHTHYDTKAAPTPTPVATTEVEKARRLEQLNIDLTAVMAGISPLIKQQSSLFCAESARLYIIDRIADMYDAPPSIYDKGFEEKLGAAMAATEDKFASLGYDRLEKSKTLLCVGVDGDELEVYDRMLHAVAEVGQGNSKYNPVVMEKAYHRLGGK